MSQAPPSPLGIFDSGLFPEVFDDPSSAGAGNSLLSRGPSSAVAVAVATASAAVAADNSGSQPYSSYESPIAIINREVRRKNVAAAATVATAGARAAVAATSVTDPSLTATIYDADSGMLSAALGGNWATDHDDGASHVGSSSYYDDPWQLTTEGSTHQQQSLGLIQQQKQTPAGFAWDHQRVDRSHVDRRGTLSESSSPPFWPASSHPSTRKKAGGGVGEKRYSLGEPRHVRSLLQSTPQFRIVCPASTDMQGGGQAFGVASTHNILIQFVSGLGGGGQGVSSGGGTAPSSSTKEDPAFSGLDDYRASLVRDRVNQQAASELAGLLWVLSHEMSLEDYGIVESEVFSAVFGLVHSGSKDCGMAGLAALDALVETPSADDEKKSIKFANTLSKALRSANGDYEFLSAASRALGHMAKRTANVDFVESGVTQALEWLSTERSDRRLAACLTLHAFAIHAPTTFHSKTSQSSLGRGGSNEFLDHIFQAIRDSQPIVRAAAADALSQCLKILVERRHLSLTGLLCRVYFDTLDGLRADSGPQKRKKTWQAIAAAEASQHGSLLVVGTLVAYTKDFMVPRLEEICREVLKFTTHQKALMRLEVARLIPRLAVCLPLVFGRRFLDQSLMFLIESASAPTPPKVSIDIRPSSFTSIGLLVTALTVEKGEVIGASNLPTIKISDDPENPGLAHIVDLCSSGIIYEKLDVIFALVRRGLAQPVASGGSAGASTVSEALHCASQLVEGLGELAHPYIRDLIDEMFSAGLSGDLIRCLHSIAQCVPDMQSDIEERILQEVSYCLAGMRDAYDPLAPFQASALEARARQNVRKRRHVVRITEPPTAPDEGTEVHDKIRINSSDDPETVKALVLSLQTLAFFGGMKGGVTTSGAVIPLLPFVQDVAAQYLHHPSSEVRRAAALSCCVLLVVPGTELRLMGRYTGGIVEDMLRRLLRVAISDPSPVVRLCVVRALDSRYDAYLCQNHHLQELFVLMQDEAVVTRAAGLRLLGRLAQLNPAPILPVLRRFLDDLIVELQCGVDSGRGREDATRLLVVFLRAKPLQRLIPPVLASLIASLPLDGTGPPRLASASLEALGVLAEATGQAFQPWLKDVVPHVLEIMQDQSSASKQRTSLRTLGQIAGSTGYVVRPYLDYPDLLTQATGILPATKRAPWSLRREVIRTLGILGALDPDRVLSVSRKSGAVGGAYFEELDVYVAESTSMTSDNQSRLGIASIDGATQHRKAAQSSLAQSSAETDEDLPACLFMYEQYTMAAQPLSTLQPARRLTPLDDDFYPTVAIQALMRIFRDQALVAHHGMVIQAIMFIFKSLGVGCVPYLRRVVPSLLLTVRTCSSSTLREALLKQLVLLSPIAREHLRPYIADVFDLVEQFWSSRHLATILSLISKVAVGVPDEFRRFVPRLIKRLLTSLDEVQVADWASDSLAQVSNRARAESEKLSLIVRSVSNLRCVLGDYLHVLVPAFIKLADALASLSMAGCPGLTGVLLDLSTLLYRTISVLLESQSSAASVLSPQSVFWDVSSMSVAFQSSENGLPSRVVQPLVRLLRDKPPRSPTIGLALIETICVCARLIGAASWMKLYDTTVRQAIRTWQRSFSALTPGSRSTAAAHDIAGVDERLKTCMRLYDDAINDMFRPPPQPQPRSPVNRSNSLVVESSLFWVEAPGTGISSFELSETFDLSSSSPFHFGSFQPVNSHKVNQSNLQRAWDVSQSTSREDWDEWIRRLAIQLLREAPSPALRATASLAHAYQPLARELFSAAFACCWKELTAPYRMNLVHALETAFVADVSPEILQALLNLAEFMEYDPDGLPIDIPILADLALKCRAYAKAINYREREYSLGRSNSCVESLMSINQKLDLPDAALGILKTASLESEAFSSEETQVAGSDFSAKHKACDMFYSVVWGTEVRVPTSSDPGDLIAEQELWLARLGNWSEALSVYQDKLKRDQGDFEALLGCMRCLDSNAEWKEVLKLFDENVGRMKAPSSRNHLQLREDIPPRSRRKALRMCAHAAWRLGQWGDLDKFATELVRGSAAPTFATQSSATPDTAEVVAPQILDFDAAFYSAITRIHRRQWQDAAEAIDSARKAMDGRLTALMAESYSRAYPSMVTAQTLAEMEEIIQFRQDEEYTKRTSCHHTAVVESEDRGRCRLLKVWSDRLAGCRVDAEVHAAVLAVRSLVMRPEDSIESTLKLSTLCDQAQRYSFVANVLLRPLSELNADLNGAAFGFGLAGTLGPRIDFDKISAGSLSSVIDQVVVTDLKGIFRPFGQQEEQWIKNVLKEAGGFDRLAIQYQLYFEYVKHLWLTDRRDEALLRIENLSEILDLLSQNGGVRDSSLRVSCFLELGDWKLSGASLAAHIDERMQLEVLTSYKRASLVQNCGYKAWHAWALINFRIAVQQGENIEAVTKSSPQELKRLRNHVVAAVQGFVHAISVGTRRESASVQQDLLNLLSCLFQYGNLTDVASVISASIDSIALEAWLGVLPQLLARIHIKEPSIRAVLHPLLTKLGEKHPQALMYPLSVLLKSPVTERKNAAESLMNTLKAHSSDLVEQALMVSSELIRVAILWLETWHEGLEDASRLYFVEGNVAGMLEILLPLHDKVESGAETGLERDFLNSFGHDLSQAHLHIQDYVRLVTEGGASVPTGPDTVSQPRHSIQSEEAEAAMNRAWDIYYTFFRRVNKQLPSLTTLELSKCSPALSHARGLELGVPGTYRIDGSYVKINRFVENIHVFTSKQRPRKITIRGSDGHDYMFLLKGHEDLRQDERVMQLFGLVNALLVRDPQTRKHDLRIQRYAISPLSHNCGLVGWVPHCDLLHSLIRDYRQSKKIALNMENREMLKMAPDYDLLTVMQKVEVFTRALRKTTGQGNDLYEILWLKSTNSEEWLERRTKYTRSLAVMSIVGYILGLGDRHPSNLMIDKVSGRVLHIDFGDCFEVAMMREKFPERVPFRLTRMLIKAMEVSGIEGSYRSTCERVMSVLRTSRDSLIAMLEAFVYDPLISWRLVDLDAGGHSDSSFRLQGDRFGPNNVDVPVSSHQSGAPIELSGPNRLPDVSEVANEDDELDEPLTAVGTQDGEDPLHTLLLPRREPLPLPSSTSGRASRSIDSRSLRMYSNIQMLAANVSTESRIASLTAGTPAGEGGDGAFGRSIHDENMSRSRMERSMRQRELFSLLEGAEGAAHEEALNEKALKVIRRVQDKLTGTDFGNSEPTDVADQVQRLIVQATSSENLCQLFVGWCAFW